MKKLLALLLAVLMVVPMMVFPTSAAEATALPTDIFAPVISGDNMPSADADHATLTGSSWNGATWAGEGKSVGNIFYDNAQKGVGYKVTDVPAGSTGIKFWCTPVSLSGMSTLCFDLYIEDADAAWVSTQTWKLEFGNNAATLRNMNGITLVDLFGNKGSLKDGWNRFEIPLTRFGTNANVTSLGYLRLYSRTDSGKLTINNTTVMMRNVYLTAQHSTIIMGEQFLGADKANVHLKENNTNIKMWAGGNWYQSTPLNYVHADQAVVSTITDPITTDAGVKFHYSSAWNDVSGKEAFCFDLYIEDADAAWVTSQTWKIELYFVKDDNTVISGNGYNANGFTLEWLKRKSDQATGHGTAKLVDGWNHFEIPLTLLTKNASNVARRFQYFRLFARYDSTKTLINNTVLKMKNVYFSNEFDWNTTPSTPGVAKVASAQPTLTNSFNLKYTVSADANIVCKPLVDLTYGDTTTRQTLSTDGTFAFNDIFAHRIADTITTTVTALDKNGDIVKSTHTYSVKDYGERMLAKESIEGYSADKLTAFKRLVSDMLYYGAAAQTYANYNADNLASNVSGIVPNTNVGESFAIAESTLTGRPSGEYSGTGPKWRGVTLVLDSAMCIRYSFTADSVEGLALTCSNGKSYTSFASASDANGTYYYIDVPVNATEFDTAFTVSFDGVENYDLAYSVNHYVATKRDPSMIKTSALLEAIYNYGVSADAFAAAQ